MGVYIMRHTNIAISADHAKKLWVISLGSIRVRISVKEITAPRTQKAAEEKAAVLRPA